MTLCSSKTCLVGKTVIITGANSGIGYETALDLAKRGARIILACRDAKRGEEACQNIIQTTANQQILYKPLDLASFQSVRDFAQDFLQSEPRLDILINNAGLGGPENETTIDGNILVMQVNYYSSFLLTNLLLDLLKKSGNGRIINLTSIAAIWAQLDLDHLDNFPGKFTAYCNSKLCTILFTKELAKRLENTGVVAYSVHPGTVQTNLYRDVPLGLGKLFFVDFVIKYFFATGEEGAQTSIYTAVSKNLEQFSGGHFTNCKLAKDYSKARDYLNLTEKLWEKSAAICNIGNFNQ